MPELNCSTVKRRWPMPPGWPAAAAPPRAAADGAGAGGSTAAGPRLGRPAAGAAISAPPAAREGRRAAGASVGCVSRACSSSDPDPLIRQMYALMDLVQAGAISPETGEEWAWVIRHEDAIGG